MNEQALGLLLHHLPLPVVALDAAGGLALSTDAADSLLAAAGLPRPGQPGAGLVPAAVLDQLLAGQAPPDGLAFAVPGLPHLAARARPVPGTGGIAGVLLHLEEPGAPSSAGLSRELEAIFDSCAEEIFVTDGEGITLRVNAVCQRFYGMGAEELVGRHVADLERAGIFSPSATLLTLRERHSVTVVQTTQSGRTAVVTANPVFDEAGRIVRVVCCSRDVTDLLQLRHQLEEAETRRRQAASALAELRMEAESLPGVVGVSPGMRHAAALARKVAAHDATVLLLGESGVGKNALAGAIHDLSPRTAGPFVEVNCGAIPETLLESELFGYNPGAFTGALRSGRPGMFEAAGGGTLFLNEVGDLPLALQVKLLSVIQERRVTRLGGTRSIPLDVRLVVATNRDLDGMVRAGRFRADLYYRLNVVPIHIPPLRERPADVPLLVRHFLAACNQRFGVRKQLSGAALQRLLAYGWPGNVRELENCIERMVITSDGDVMDVGDLPPEVAGAPVPVHVPAPAVGPPATRLNDAVAAAERQVLAEALRAAGSTHKAAALLGISQSSVARKARRYGLYKAVAAAPCRAEPDLHR